MDENEYKPHNFNQNKTVRTLMCVGGVVLGLFFGAIGLHYLGSQVVEIATGEDSAAEKAEDTTRRLERVENLEKAVYALVNKSPKYEVRTVNFNELKKLSEPGEIITDYVTKVNASADKAIAELNKYTKENNLPAEQAQINDINRQRTNISANANRFFRQLLDKALKEFPLPAHVLLIEDTFAVSKPDGIDMTAELAQKMQYLKPQLPNVPEFKITLPAIKKKPAAKKK